MIGKPPGIGDRGHQKRQRRQREDRVFGFQRAGEGIASLHPAFRDRRQHARRFDAGSGIETRLDRELSCAQLSDMFCKGRQANARHGILRILRRHVPDGLRADRGRMQQQDGAGQQAEKRHVCRTSRSDHVSRRRHQPDAGNSSRFRAPQIRRRAPVQASRHRGRRAQSTGPPAPHQASVRSGGRSRQCRWRCRCDATARSTSAHADWGFERNRIRSRTSPCARRCWRCRGPAGSVASSTMPMLSSARPIPPRMPTG